jgi:Flp pilus assembly protein TadD
LVREDPNDVDVLNNLGYLFATRGQVARAIEMYQRSARLAPGDAETASTLGQLFAMRGDAGRARSYFERALDLDPGNAEARRRLAAVGVEAEAREAK